MNLLLQTFGVIVALILLIALTRGLVTIAGEIADDIRNVLNGHKGFAE